MHKSLLNTTFVLTGLLVLSSWAAQTQKKNDLPNIIIIYADDMGYGDVAYQNPKSKIPTPHIDRLAQEGMRFVDAHSSSGICTPSRFALLTGTYHWRRAHDIVNSFGPPYFKDSDVTIPMLLKQKDYVTGCIGKWHLGWNWHFNNKPSGETVLWRKPHKYYLPKDVNFTNPITGGPLDRGFDSYFGDGTINFPPYAWIENDRFIDIPTESLDLRDLKTKEGNWEFRPGPMVAGWDPYQVLPTLEKQGVAFIKQQQADKPFFLYFALPSPHAPIIPNDEFDGKSQAGAYGDFVVQTDQVVGNLLQALHEKKLDQNTLIIFTSDNGPEIYAFERARDFDHHSMGKLRGLKRDVWEGGHRVPFIVKWPGKISADTVSDETINQVDIMATLAKVTGCSLPEKAAPDSYDLLPVLLGKSYQQPLREATVQNTFKDKYGIRQGKWMLIETNSGQHSKTPDWYNELKNFPSFDSEPILFDLSADPGQRKNLAKDNPTRVAKMQALLKQYQSQGYSVTRSAQPKGSLNLEAGLQGRDDIVCFVDFESEDWTKDWNGFGHKQNMHLVDSQLSEHLGEDLSGKALEILVKKGEHYGISGKFKFKEKLGYEPEELYARFYTYYAEDFGNQDGHEGYKGKAPGFDGTYDREGWGGKPNSDGTKGWSCRGANGVNKDDDKIRLSFYAYEVKTGRYNYGKTMTFDKQVEADQWYCVEQYIKLNTPGKKDGIAHAWLDGELVFEKTDFLWRTTDQLKIYSYWVDYYRGGKKPAYHDHHIYLDNLVIATGKRIGLFTPPVAASINEWFSK